jgi:acetyl esterase/lipase
MPAVLPHGACLARAGAAALLALAALARPSRSAAQPAEPPLAPDAGRLVAETRCAAHDQPYAAYAERVRAALARQLDSLAAVDRVDPPRDAAARQEREGLRAELRARRPMAQGAYDATFHSGRYECRRIAYRSDGLRVVGYAFRPAGAPPAAGRPVLLALRGGTGEFGKVTEPQMAGWAPALDAGYLILLPQYRGNDGGEGREDWGGDDVRDVLALPRVAAALGGDTARLVVWGGSRGGMMALAALARGLPARAAVVQAAPTDLEANARLRPVFDTIYAELDPRTRTDAAYRAAWIRRRSALAWAEAIRTPLLLLHGTADWRVAPEQSLALAGRLQALGRPYGLVMYADGDHGLRAQRADVDRQMLAWFARYAAPASDSTAGRAGRGASVAAPPAGRADAPAPPARDQPDRGACAPRSGAVDGDSVTGSHARSRVPSDAAMPGSTRRRLCDRARDVSVAGRPLCMRRASRAAPRSTHRLQPSTADSDQRSVENGHW